MDTNYTTQHYFYLHAFISSKHLSTPVCVQRKQCLLHMLMFHHRSCCTRHNTELQQNKFFPQKSTVPKSNQASLFGSSRLNLTLSMRWKPYKADVYQLMSENIAIRVVPWHVSKQKSHFSISTYSHIRQLDCTVSTTVISRILQRSRHAVDIEIVSVFMHLLSYRITIKQKNSGIKS